MDFVARRDVCGGGAAAVADEDAVHMDGRHIRDAFEGQHHGIGE
jgi:hypothetical protein